MQERRSATRLYTPRPADSGPLVAVIAAAAAAVACFLPWFRIDLHKLGAAFDRAASDAFVQLDGGSPLGGASGSRFGEAMNGVFGSLGLQGTLDAAGIDGWIGISVLVLMGGFALVQMLAASGTHETMRGLASIGVILAVLATCLALYACTQLSGPVRPHIGLVVAIAGCAVATTASIRRLGSMQQPRVAAAA